MTGAGLVAEEIGRRFYGGSKVEAAPLVETLPERVSWETHVPYRASFQGTSNCTSLATSELMRMEMNRLYGGFREGICNQASSDPYSDQVFNPNFLTGSWRSVVLSLYQTGDALVRNGICRNHIAPNFIEQGDPTSIPTDEQKQDALNYRPSSFDLKMYNPTEIRQTDAVAEVRKRVMTGPIVLGFPTFPGSLETYNGGFVKRLSDGQEFTSGHAVPLIGYDDNVVTPDGSMGVFYLWWSQLYDVSIAMMPYEYVNDVGKMPDTNLNAYIDTLKLNFDQQPPATPTPAPELKNKVFIPLVVRNE